MPARVVAIYHRMEGGAEGDRHFEEELGTYEDIQDISLHGEEWERTALNFMDGHIKEIKIVPFVDSEEDPPLPPGLYIQI